MHPENRTRLAAGASLALLAVVYGFILVTHASRSVGGSDSSGYFNSARALARGRIVEPIEALAALGLEEKDVHLVIPLGYVPGPRPGTMASFYPPGLPLQIVLAAAVGGWTEAPFWLSPLFAVACVVLTYLIGRELALSRAASLACSAMLACLPVLNFQAMQLMSDTAAAAWALAAILCALRARRRDAWALAAGFAFGMAVLVRPASAVLFPALAIALPLRPRGWILFLAGGAPCAVFFGAYNFIGYGGALKTGYGAGGAFADFRLANFALQLRLYLGWLAPQATPFLLAAAALYLVDRRRSLRDRLLLAAWFGGFLLLYSFYGPWDAWWYTRYLLPAIPALYLAAAAAVEDAVSALRSRAAAGRRSPRRFATFASAAALLLVLWVCWTGLNLGRRHRLLELGRSQAVFPETIDWARPLVPPNGLVLAMEFSGAMRAYGWGTFVRWDYVERDRFPSLRRELEGRGFRLYALVLPHEAREAAPRVPGTWTYLGSNRDAALFRLD